MSIDSTSIKTKTTSEKIYSYKSRKINNSYKDIAKQRQKE
ncbi:hypothetical protein EA83_01261 [Enterococcus faecium]|nr:hypothetical protein EA83_01261 [Enterococcus faecium]RBT15881.1 hypothetical protein EA95_01851 [Enterococcus faecium]RBT27873.1 hypothetical protein EA72_01176 [Enterococcus faecium]RBT33161.1 hypothetical protein EB01_01132 [Enterococcus faecium]